MHICKRESTTSAGLKMENPSAARPSPLFLVEAIGDSEGYDSGSNADVFETGEADYDSDDAESCSYDSSDLRILDPDDSKGCDSEVTGAAAGINEDELQTDRFPGYRDLQIPPAEQKSCVSVDSASPVNEFMDEMERSRLFWEACLASS